MNNLDWITYVPRRVYDAATSLEAACERCGHPSPIGVAEDRMSFRHSLSARVHWNQVWAYMMESHNVTPDYNIRFVVVDDPAFGCLYSVAPCQLH